MDEKQVRFLLVVACLAAVASIGVLSLEAEPVVEQPEPYMVCEYFSEDNVNWFRCTERGEPAKIGEVR